MPKRYSSAIAKIDVLPSHSTALPTNLPVANYYRQSTNEQVGNVSTTLQTVDMPFYLQKLGWDEANIRMIDMDEGVSGTKKIDEREGMRLLFDMITSDKLGAVACQDEDRLFRDVTQIQVNIFIEACRAHNVLVITPSMIYDFAHPSFGTFHARQFRFKSEMAADFIKTIIHGKLHAAKTSLAMGGRWPGHPIPIGYMVDTRKTLPGGLPNEHYKKYAVFEPYAEVVREYFRMYAANSGMLRATVRQILESGPFFPDPNICKPPEGYKTHYRIEKYEHGWCIGRYASLARLLSNAVYLGHWVVKDVVIRWDNHPPIVDEETFYCAFNYLSPIDLNGTKNKQYRPNQTNTRSTRTDGRAEELPLCSGIMVSLWEDEWKTVGTRWDRKDKHYFYAFCGNDGFSTPVWNKKALYVDKAITTLLLEKLNLTFDYESWSETIDAFAKEMEQQRQLNRKQLKHLETVMKNLAASLESISTPDLIAQIEQRFRDAQSEYKRLQEELSLQTPNVINPEKIKRLKQSYDQALENWESMTNDEKRELLHVFITRIEVKSDENRTLSLTIYWQDNSTDWMTINRVATTGTPWMPHENELLIKLGSEGVSKLEIAKAFPTRRWNEIFNKYRRLTNRTLVGGKRGESTRKTESYEEYLIRRGLAGTPNTISEAGS